MQTCCLPWNIGKTLSGHMTWCPSSNLHWKDPAARAGQKSEFGSLKQCFWGNVSTLKESEPKFHQKLRFRGPGKIFLPKKRSQLWIGSNTKKLLEMANTRLETGFNIITLTLFSSYLILYRSANSWEVRFRCQNCFGNRHILFILEASLWSVQH